MIKLIKYVLAHSAPSVIKKETVHSGITIHAALAWQCGGGDC